MSLKLFNLLFLLSHKLLVSFVTLNQNLCSRTDFRGRIFRNSLVPHTGFADIFFVFFLPFFVLFSRRQVSLTLKVSDNHLINSSSIHSCTVVDITRGISSKILHFLCQVVLDWGRWQKRKSWPGFFIKTSLCQYQSFKVILYIRQMFI